MYLLGHWVNAAVARLTAVDHHSEPNCRAGRDPLAPFDRAQRGPPPATQTPDLHFVMPAIS